jgi:hypothetical protein
VYSRERDQRVQTSIIARKLHAAALHQTPYRTPSGWAQWPLACRPPTIYPPSESAFTLPSVLMANRRTERSVWAAEAPKPTPSHLMLLGITRALIMCAIYCFVSGAVPLALSCVALAAGNELHTRVSLQPAMAMHVCHTLGASGFCPYIISQ